ncbi:sigma-54-dependent transcriptional regulator [Gemmatimonadota bacterium]
MDILFVDDRWCTPEGQDIILGNFGGLTSGEQPYRFHYETGETSPSQYSPEPVLKRIQAIPSLSAVVLDIMFGDEGDRLGLDILAAIREQYPTLPVFIMTFLERDNYDVVEQAMELGANEYLTKGVSAQDLRDVLDIYANPSSTRADYAIWGNSSAIRKVRAHIVRAATGNPTSILITGESGTGKELAARAVHRQGPRRASNFIPAHLAVFPSELVADELFGHEKGAYTNAIVKREGRFESAHGGTLFLDEISQINPEMQIKLLRVLEERKFERVGGNKEIEVDIQLIVATNENLRALVDEGLFREDLFYRLNVVNIDLPPLRDRRDDIPIFAGLFLHRFCENAGSAYQARRFSESALSLLSKYDWPGNIRELKNTIEGAAISCRTDQIEADHLPEVVLNRKPQILSVESADSLLPADDSMWGKHRVLHELLTLEDALRKKQGSAALAIHTLFPLITSPNATYVKRYIKRLQEAPWGCESDSEIEEIITRIHSLQ